MEKTIYTREYEAVVRQLRESRKKARVTQIQLAERLGLTQSMVSKIERGDRRLDIIELRTACHAIGISLTDFVAALEKKLATRRH
jgi:transcriptional regulator with XRE-family HTH domain